MKFGERLEKEKRPQWVDFYIDYHKLKAMILELETQERYKGAEDMEQQNTSLSVPLPTDSSGTPVSKRTFSVDETHITQENFFHVLEQVWIIICFQTIDVSASLLMLVVYLLHYCRKFLKSTISRATK
jgi:hypothetical protein